ncbi:MAG: hypothetical protein A2268_01690 [Candidatus Raymondbacteria bacterium RifOxyA12_full_50_37]|uniref:Antitoxin n=1 Tax=Candidatus Raymondbacteria bacterium RIFOXYD12_FULL_49_13 TaxID=1817890 RepID=A0A1F7FA84_UNCRA|nr:MAG: hypothetical protein A2268_01690 [Candidatus Raymondbacteria bacterium RifOxyA12_full_50_37]OGJ87778.1 MAG: hypothetical protein A2248_07295 [Candidatus Raymondbacteria bacterium RIFOXYA2_FULL_49_16]OGJ92485.1 MAG: hypothetical protein A2350_02955 [Candidatus Raymondbacteria bacterium RifOxyB12_full_50_8]OGJ95455.1 MAG: hypothetical protein A2487_15740 [Candidatus Raymondbacteria bacterium RifOxyC12_full_50_8]OGJ95656.1 MAG: hypothetical protein A2453_13290 [Candidatus Raymondbacteria b
MTFSLKTIRPITELRTRADDLFKLSKKSDGPVVITQNGVAVGVLMAADIYERLQDNVEESRLLEMMDEAEKDIKNNDTFSHAEFKKRVETALKSPAK